MHAYDPNFLESSTSHSSKYQEAAEIIVPENQVPSLHSAGLKADLGETVAPSADTGNCDGDGIHDYVEDDDDDDVL